MKYVRFCKKLNDHGELVPYGTEFSLLDTEKEAYRSVYNFNEEHFQKFLKTGSVAGFSGMTTSFVFLDFDSEDNLEAAKADTLACLDKLQSIGISHEDIDICFSGSKGFSISFELHGELTEQEYKSFYKAITAGLETTDLVVTNPNRIARLPYSTHGKTGKKKTVLLKRDLLECSVGDIIAMSVNGTENGLSDRLTSAEMIKEWTAKQAPKPKEIKLVKVDLDFPSKVKGLSNCKWAILNGYVVKGNRNNAYTALAATLKNLGYPKDVVYSMLKSANRMAEEKEANNAVDKTELYTVVSSVFNPNWQGGTYTCKKEGWLKDFCDSLGDNKCKHDHQASDIMSMDTVLPLFKKYADEYGQNVITTGMAALDKKCKFLVGTSSFILGPPGSAKSSLSMQILNHNSLLGIPSVFFSLDMFYTTVITSVARRHFTFPPGEIKMTPNANGVTTDDLETRIFEHFKQNTPKAQAIMKTIREQYKNVHWCFKSAIDVDSIPDVIKEAEEISGQKIKLAVIDYSELINTGISDPTQASAVSAQRVRQYANDLQVAFITLLQPNKANADLRKEMTSYTAAKGSGSIAQSAQLMLSLSRPGFDPRNPQNDKFLTINALKNRTGPTFSVDLKWIGEHGRVDDLSDEELRELDDLRERLQEESRNDGGI